MLTAVRSVAILSLVAGLAACGIKNDPVPPTGDNGAAGEVGGGVAATAVDVASPIQDEYTVSAGQVSRNPNASRQNFFLDFLLN